MSLLNNARKMYRRLET